MHNSAAGYWGIATACHESSTSLSACDQTFAAGLTEAAIQCLADDKPILFAGFDIPPPSPLSDINRNAQPLGVSVLLSPTARPDSMVSLDMTVTSMAQDSDIPVPELQQLATNTTMARCLPLLAAIASQEARDVTVAGEPGLSITVSPC